LKLEGAASLNDSWELVGGNIFHTIWKDVCFRLPSSPEKNKNWKNCLGQKHTRGGDRHKAFILYRKNCN
jgi:hypothetical protein